MAILEAEFDHYVELRSVAMVGAAYDYMTLISLVSIRGRK
jgi:hypothetical protein